MWYTLTYQDGPDGPQSIFSYHRSSQAALKAKQKASKDPYWRSHIFTIFVTSFKPRVYDDIKDWLEAEQRRKQIAQHTSTIPMMWK